MENCGDDSYLVLKLSLLASFVKLVRPLISEWKITLSVKHGQARDKYCKDWYGACETLECESEQDQPKGYQDLHQEISRFRRSTSTLLFFFQ